jgi:hypothetical protein
MVRGRITKQKLAFEVSKLVKRQIKLIKVSVAACLYQIVCDVESVRRNRGVAA